MFLPTPEALSHGTQEDNTWGSLSVAVQTVSHTGLPAPAMVS
jgi:hypothetical protein